MQREHTTGVKILTYTLFLLVCYLLETATGLCRLQLFGVRIDVLCCIPAAVALMEDPAVGAAVGLMTGLLYDVSGAGIEGLYPRYFMLFGALAGAVGGRYLRRIWPSHLLLTAGGMLVLRGLQFMLAALIGTGYPVLPFLKAMYGEILAAVVLSPLIYLPALRIARRFDRLK